MSSKRALVELIDDTLLGNGLTHLPTSSMLLLSRLTLPSVQEQNCQRTDVRIKRTRTRKDLR